MPLKLFLQKELAAQASRYLLGCPLSVREIAERLNISVKTVEKHIGAALSQLRLRLSRSGFLRLFL